MITGRTPLADWRFPTRQIASTTTDERDAGSWRVRGLHSPASTSDNSPVSGVQTATSVSSHDPACDATPSLLAVTVILGHFV
jgi:hypothetical protein